MHLTFQSYENQNYINTIARNPLNINLTSTYISNTYTNPRTVLIFIQVGSDIIVGIHTNI